MYETELEVAILDCELKAKNLQTATESLLINKFSSIWMLENYLSCVEESKSSVLKLLELKNDE